MEEDYKLFQLIKRNPINNCMDLSKSMRGKRNGIFYFTEKFRIDFENKMSELGRLKEENKKLEEDYTSVYLKGVYDERDKWKSKIKEKIEELDKNGYWDYLENRDLEKTISILQELLEKR